MVICCDASFDATMYSYKVLTIAFRSFHALRTWKVHLVMFSYHTTPSFQDGDEAIRVERLGRPEFRPGKLAEFKLRARNKFPSSKSLSGTDEMFRDVANNNTRTRDALHRESQPIAIVISLF